MKKFINSNNTLIENNEWYLEDLDNKEFRKLCYLVAEGKFSLDIINNKNKINKIYEEAYYHKILPQYELLNLHAWALYNYGYNKHCPKLPLHKFSRQKVYQVLIQKGCNDIYNIGYYYNLEEAINDINACLYFCYEDVKIRKEDLNSCTLDLHRWYSYFNLDLNSLYKCKNDELCIKGFVYDYEELLEELGRD